MTFKNTIRGIIIGTGIGVLSSHEAAASLKIKSQQQVQLKPIPLMLAKSFDSEVSIPSFFVSEKLDGVRAYWDGINLYSRSGRLINVPDWFVQDFPKHSLDGELWIARGKFEKVSGLIRRKNPDPQAWRNVRYHIFDLPSDKSIFSLRNIRLRELQISNRSSYIKIIQQKRLETASQLTDYFETVVAKGGEGLMLHQKDAFYTAGRTNALLKLKPFDDAEAKVIGYTEGRGKYQGMLGAIEVENTAGKRFKIGSGFSLQQRQNPPALGSIITYRYRGLTSNRIPRFATFLRIKNLE